MDEHVDRLTTRHSAKHRNDRVKRGNGKSRRAGQEARYIARWCGDTADGAGRCTVSEAALVQRQFEAWRGQITCTDKQAVQLQAYRGSNYNIPADTRATCIERFVCCALLPGLSSWQDKYESNKKSEQGQSSRIQQHGLTEYELI